MLLATQSRRRRDSAHNGCDNWKLKTMRQWNLLAEGQHSMSAGWKDESVDCQRDNYVENDDVKGNDVPYGAILNFTITK